MQNLQQVLLDMNYFYVPTNGQTKVLENVDGQTILFVTLMPRDLGTHYYGRNM